MAHQGDTVSGANQGPAVDRIGAPVVDPTDNVKALNEAASKRQDNLREASEKYSDMRLDYIEKIADLRSFYDDKLRDKESERLDAIRSVDAAAVQSAAAAATAAAVALADKVAQSAEQLRTQVEAQRITTADALAGALGPINARLDSVLNVQTASAGERSGTTSASELAARTRTTVLGAVVALVAVAGLYTTFHNNKSGPAAPTVSCSVAAAGEACIK